MCDERNAPADEHQLMLFVRPRTSRYTAVRHSTSPVYARIHKIMAESLTADAYVQLGHFLKATDAGVYTGAVCAALPPPCPMLATALDQRTQAQGSSQRAATAPSAGGQPVVKPHLQLCSSRQLPQRVLQSTWAIDKATELLEMQHPDVLDAIAAAHSAIANSPTKYLTDALALTPPLLHAAAAREHVRRHDGQCFVAFPDANRCEQALKLVSSVPAVRAVHILAEWCAPVGVSNPRRSTISCKCVR